MFAVGGNGKDTPIGNRKTLLEDFGRLEDNMKASLAEFRENIMGTDLLESGFC